MPTAGELISPDSTCHLAITLRETTPAWPGRQSCRTCLN
jgi:hypothetical protein